MADSILQVNGAANLDPVGTGDVPPVDATVVDVSSGDAGAALVVGDPGLAASADGGAPAATASPLPPPRSSGVVGDAVKLSGSLAEGGPDNSIAAGSDAIATLGFDRFAPADAAAASGVTVTQFSGSVVAGGVTADSAEPASADGGTAASGGPIIAAGLAGGAVADAVVGGGSTGASSGSASTASAATSGLNNFGTGFDAVTSVVVSGSGGLTFDISFDASVSSAPSGFDAGVEAAFQYYADTFNGSGVTLYFNVGFGELSGSPIASGDLGESFTFFGGQQTYSTLSSTMSARATTAADKAAVANDLPAIDPTGGKTLDMARAEEKALGLVSGTVGSFADPDGDIGFSSTASFDYTSGQTPTSGSYYFLGVVEHEISEVMGRDSWLDLNGTTDYSPMDLFRFSGSGTDQFTTGNPSYFSLDGGKTDLYHWNNFTTGNFGDLGDWAATSPYTPDSFNDNSSSGVINPITSRDTTLMDVIGWERTSSTIYTVSSGQTSKGIIIYSGDQELVQSGGTAKATYALSGGVQAVAGVDSGATIGSGALQDVFGSASGVVLDGGLQVVESGGRATSTTILSGGRETVSSGGTASAPTISGSGAVLDLSSGAIVSGGITFSGSGGQLRVGDSAAPSNTISGFTGVGDVIDLTGLTFSGNTSVGFDPLTDVLTVTEGANSATIQLDLEIYAGITWSATQDSGSGTAVAACFRRGTLIWTERGEVPVEDLAIGDEVVILSGEARPIKWIGRRAYDDRFVAGNRTVLPIRIEAGSLDDDVPTRDLWISPEHALHIDGVLVPACLLVNGATITQVERTERLEYFHIELDRHAVILAEGAPAESFVDCDNRFMFHNGEEFAALYPDDTPAPWDFCALRLDEASPELPAIRAALRKRAEALGDRLADDPDLRLIIDGEVVRPQAVGEEVYSFTIPAGSGAIWLASRSAIPAEVEVSSQDRRRLGVAIARIILAEADLRIEIGYGHPGLREGFHDSEGGYRWTDGMARLPEELLRPFAAEFTIGLHLIKPGFRYPIGTPAGEAAPARRRRSPRARR